MNGEIFEGFMSENPYYILGLPCCSGKRDIKKAAAKLQQLERAGALESYKEVLDLGTVKKPDRSREKVNSAVSILNDPKGSQKWRWLSFAKDEYSRGKWSLFPATIRLKDYDAFLAAYYRTLLFDSSFQSTADWRRVIFRAINDYFVMKDAAFAECIKDRLPQKERLFLNASREHESFRQSILEPVFYCFENLDEEGYISFNRKLYEHISEFEFASMLRKKYTEVLKGWLDDELHGLSQIKLLNQHETTPEQAEEVVEKLRSFEKEKYDRIRRVIDSLPKESGDFHYLSNKLWETIYHLTVMIWIARPEESVYFDCLVMDYCEDTVLKRDNIKLYIQDDYLSYMQKIFSIVV